MLEQSRRATKINILIENIITHYKYMGTKYWHSRMSDTVFWNNMIVIGRDPNAIEVRREHIVPCSALLSECFLRVDKFFNGNYNNEISTGPLFEELFTIIDRNLFILLLDKNKSEFLDSKYGLGLRNKMPENWCFETGDPLIRIKMTYDDPSLESIEFYKGIKFRFNNHF